MKRLRLILPVAACFLLAASVAYASGGHGEEHTIPWMNYFWRVLNFALFLFLLYKFAGKKAADFFGGRSSGIKNELEDLETRKAEASKKLAEVEKSIANIAQEKAAILEEAKTQGEALKASIIEKAEKTAAQMAEQAKLTAQNEAKAEMDRMRAEMADLVVEAAAKLVEEKLGEKEHEKLVDEYLTKVVLN